MFRGKQKTKILVVSFILVLSVFVPAAHATCDPNLQTCSTNYGVSESFFGNGGELNACSGSYCTKQSAGETGVGNTSSTSYQSQAGFNTTPDPYLEFTVTNSNVDLGILSTSSASTTTGTFTVRAYLSSGYYVTTASDPPSSGGHTLSALSSPTASSPGTEQFGINLVANTSPTTFGSNPSQVPDTTFGFGQAATGYDTANFYKYNKGDTIASSSKSSGTTQFTISYLYNISNTTPGGQYTFNHVLVATATF